MRVFAVVLTLVSFTAELRAAPPPPPPAAVPLLLRQPTVSRTQICFSYAGDLWIVDRKGGLARRLTTDVGNERDPAFSPDGTLIAFTGEYDGNPDVYVIPAEGGMPRRLTSHPGGDEVLGWTRDGKRVLFRSSRNSYSRFDRLFTVSVYGGLPEELPLPTAVQGSFSPDMTHLAYVPFSNFIGTTQHVRALKHYRGGTASPIWIARLSDSHVEKVKRTDSNDSTPMWVGDKVYFLSDRGGPVALWVWDQKTHDVRQAGPSNGQDIKSASAGPDVIVYEQLGAVHLFDPATGADHAVPVRVNGDFPAARPHFEPVAKRIVNAGISPSGARAVFEAHGEILTVPADKGDIRNLTRSPAVADRDPAWSPDGSSIAWFSDEGGEYRLVIRAQDGLAPARYIALGETSFFYGPVWSPDSKKIVYCDKKLNLWYVDVARGEPVKVDTTTYDGGQDAFHPAWSPDSRFVAYATQMVSGYHAIFIYSLDEKKAHQITDGRSDAANPVFDKNGRYLYFTASTNVGPVIASSMAGYRVPVSSTGYVVVLRKDLRSPLAPQSDEEKLKRPGQSDDECKEERARAEEGSAAADKKPDDKAKGDKAEKVESVRIDFAGIDQRVLTLPFPERNYAGMLAGKSHTLFLVEGPPFWSDEEQPRFIVHTFNLCTRKTDKLLDNVGAFVVSADGKKALYESLPEEDPNAPKGGGEGHEGRWMIRPIDALGKKDPGKPDGGLKLDGMQVAVDPCAQWAQIFRESMHIERDFFYDPNLHGLDLTSLANSYRPYLAGVMSRDDLTYLLADMLGEITAQHVYLGGGEAPSPRKVPGGLLGADYVIDHGRYRISKIYRGENWNPGLRAPLTEPGVDVHVGDYLIAVDGQPLTGRDEIFALYQETAGKTVQLEVASDPTGKGARKVSVVPIPDEHALRMRDWMESNRARVEKLGGGKVAYVYLPDTAVNGFTNFNRYYFAQSDKQAAVVDERFNGGGWIADYVIDWLARPRLMMAMTREGRDNVIPQTIFGPKVMLINEYAGSGGDALPWMFRQQKLGPIVGTRTWGGLIGIGGYPSLIDGGHITAPRFALYNPDTGEFDVENKGVSPDVEVELDPAGWRQGRDPQLERGVALALQALKQQPTKRPKYPVYHWSTARTQAAKQPLSAAPQATRP
jgi:tricorn protease